MIKVTVNINGKDYNLKGRDNEEYLRQVAEYVDGKINEIRGKNQFLSTGDAAVLAAVNIADDLYENDVAYQEIKKVKVSLEERNQTLSNTIKELQDRIEKLQEENKKEVSLLNEKNDNMILEIDNLKKEKDGLDSEIKNYHESNKRLNEESVRLKKEIDKLHENIT